MLAFAPVSDLRRWMVAAAAGGMALGLAGCSAGSPKASPSGSPHASAKPIPTPTRTLPNPCTLVTTAMVNTAFGAKASAPQPGDFLGNPVCNFAVTGTSVGADLGLQVLVLVAYDRARFDSVRAGAPGDADVPGVGDAAFYDPKTAAVTLVKGGTVILIGAQRPPSGPTPDPAALENAVVAVAKAAASAL